LIGARSTDAAVSFSVKRRLHLDEAHPRKMEFPGFIAHGLFGLSLIEGVKSEMRVYEHTSIAP
jgi:hypothetical protein